MRLTSSFKELLPRPSSFLAAGGGVSSLSLGGGARGSSRNLMSLLQREAESTTTRENVSSETTLVRVVSSSSSSGKHGSLNGRTGGAVVDQKAWDEFKVVKTKMYGKLPQVCLLLARAFEQRGGLALPGLDLDLDPMVVYKARKAFQKQGPAAVEGGNASLMLVLLLDLLECLVPQDACLSPFTPQELNLMATVLNRRERMGEDCYMRATGDLATRAPLQRNVFVWLVDFLATVVGQDEDRIRLLAARFGPVLWQRQNDVKLVNPAEIEQAERDAEVVLAACIFFAKHSRRSAVGGGDVVGQPF